MELIAINFVLEFARDLQKLLEKLEKEYGQLLVVGSAYYKKKIQERASELTEELYEKYKQVLDLKLEKSEEGSNIVLKNYDNEEYLIPNEFYKGSKFYELKENFELLLGLSERGDIIWNEFSHKLFQSLNNDQKAKISIKYASLERIRFFMSFMALNEYFNFENINEGFKEVIYKPKYERWGRNANFHKIYKKYITNDKDFLSKHVNIVAIPNYPIWNLNMTYFDEITLQNLNEAHFFNYFPIQVFEDLQGSTIGIIALESDKRKKGKKIKRFSISYNFNIFPQKRHSEKSIKLENSSIFESYIKFLDEKDNESENPSFFKNNYNSVFDFIKKIRNPEYIENYLNQRMINEFNLLYNRELSNFITKFISDTDVEKSTYRYMFKSGFIFPEFNLRNVFVIQIEKKRRKIKFENLISFLKNWTFQTILYELDSYLILYGYLLPNFDYIKETTYLSELFEDLGINFKFLVTNKDIKVSNLSLYTLPVSINFQEDTKNWLLKNTVFPISIKKKEEMLISVINEEKQLLDNYK